MPKGARDSVFPRHGLANIHGARSQKTMPRKFLDIQPPMEQLSILDPEGQADAALDPRLDHDALLRIYRFMVLTRKLDDRMILMQRQGQMGTFAPSRGQEAAQIGSVYPLTKEDWFAPSYRSFGAQIWRGWPVEQLLLLWDGFFEAFRPPDGVNDLPFSIVIGCHVPVAVGLAMSLRQSGSDRVVLTNFGDGASSEGDVSEALNFAAVYDAPIVFICENNGYAISLPTEKQTRTPHLAQRAIGFGIPSLRVDGNDVLAMIEATREAVERARAGKGPTWIEAVTFRMEMHTTADDPKVYRTESEVKKWELRCPIARFEKYLRGISALDDSVQKEIAADVDEQLRIAREKFSARAIPKPREVFDFVYADPPEELLAQKQEYLAKLDRQNVK
jgi:pyruvate dehydrogenase E1 component alpha subunit